MKTYSELEKLRAFVRFHNGEALASDADVIRETRVNVENLLARRFAEKQFPDHTDENGVNYRYVGGRLIPLAEKRSNLRAK